MSAFGHRPWGLLLPCLLFFPAFAEAAPRDLRIAFLIANDQGLSSEPRLRFASSHDLPRMKEALRRIGFRTQYVFKNKSSAVIRQAMQDFLRTYFPNPQPSLLRPTTLGRFSSPAFPPLPFLPDASTSPPITFFFYYSGHAGQTALHTGPDIRNLLTYEELLRFFDAIRAPRRFALIDACFSGEIIRKFGSEKDYQRSLDRGLIAKGAPAIVPKDLRLFFARSSSRAFQLLASAETLSYESAQLQGSILTHHFLQGLRGPADLNRDGLISFEELKQYAAPLANRDTRQEARFFSLLDESSSPYPLAFHFRGNLLVPAEISDELRLAIGNLIFWIPKSSSPTLVPAVAGRGEIYRKGLGGCWIYSFTISREETLTIPSTLSLWKKVGCLQLRLKGFQELHSSPFQRQADDLTNDWAFELQAGASLSSGFFKQGGDIAGQGTFGFRHRYGAFLFGVSTANVLFSDRSFLQMLVSFRGEGGFRQLHGRFDLFLGGYLSLGLLLQDLNVSPLPSLTLQVGPVLHLGLWLDGRWALVFSADAGFHPTILRGEIHPFFSGSLRLGFRYRFGGPKYL